MNRFLILLVFIAPHFGLPAQNGIGPWKWFNTMGQGETGYGYNRVWDMCSDPQDNLIVTGAYYKEAQFKGTQGTSLYFDVVGDRRWVSTDQYYVAKYLKDGRLAWVQTGNAGGNQGLSVKTDQKGNVYTLVGVNERVVLTSADGKQISLDYGRPNVPQLLLVKYSPEGKILWFLEFDVQGWALDKLGLDENGNIYVMKHAHHDPRIKKVKLPSISAPDQFVKLYDSGDPNKPSINVIVSKYTPDGNLIWGKCIGTDSLVLSGSNLAINPLGGFAILATYRGKTKWLGKSLDSKMGGSHALVLNYDAGGNLLYNAEFGKGVRMSFEGPSPQLDFDPLGRLIVAAGIEYSPFSFIPAIGKELRYEGYNHYTAYLFVARLGQKGKLEWHYMFKDIDFDGHQSTIYPFMANPAVRTMEVDKQGNTFIGGTALNYLTLSEELEYRFDTITNDSLGLDWRKRSPFFAAFDSCGNPYWLESIRVNRQYEPHYLDLCLHNNGEMSVGLQIHPKILFRVLGQRLPKGKTDQLCFARRTCPASPPAGCEPHIALDTLPKFATMANPPPVLNSRIDPVVRKDTTSTKSKAAITKLKPDPCFKRFVLFPNPNSGTFSLNWQVTETQKYEVVISDMNGKIIQKVEKVFPNGEARMQFLRLDLAEGLYVATLRCADKAESLKFIIRAFEPSSR